MSNDQNNDNNLYHELENQISFDEMLSSIENSNDLPNNEEISKLVNDSNLELSKMSSKKYYLYIPLLCVLVSIFTSFLTNTLIIKNTDNKTIINIDSTNEANPTNIYHAVAKKASPSVVGITTTVISTNNFFNIPTENSGVGTGIILNKNGYILTNSHVVNDGESGNISVLLHDGKNFDGKILWNDPSLDLAIIKINANNLLPADLGDSDKILVGDIAIAIGNPLGLEFQQSVTAGIISGLDRSIQDSSISMNGLIQTDASINPGNSGGPLLNSKGEVVGINTAKVNYSEGMGFAIPINTVKSIANQVIKNGSFEKVMLGIKGVNLEAFEITMGIDLNTDYGIYVVEVDSNSSASKGGLKTGDIITAINNVPIKSMSTLHKELYKYSFGDTVKVSIYRDSETKTLSVKFKK